MRAIILKPNKTFFESIVFAIERIYDTNYPEWNIVSEVYFYIADENGEIKRISAFIKSHNQVLIRNLEPFDSSLWIETKELDGYDWFLKYVVDDIKNGKSVSEEIKNRCIETNENGLLFYRNNRNSNVITSKEDIENLLELTGYFHDGHFEKIEWLAKDCLRIELSQVWGFERFNLTFKGNLTTFFEDDLDEFWFSSASVFFDEDGQVCFSIDDYTSKKELEDKKVTHIYADNMEFDYIFDFDWK